MSCEGRGWRLNSPVLIRAIGDRLIVLPPSAHEPVILSATMTAVFREAQQRPCSELVVLKLADSYNLDATSIRQSVIGALVQLEQLNVIISG
jgi:hypothetical protein